jgi:hypothetical protein
LLGGTTLLLWKREGLPGSWGTPLCAGVVPCSSWKHLPAAVSVSLRSITAQLIDSLGK